MLLRKEPVQSALTTSSPSMRKALDELLLAARSEAPVMLRSEIGSEVALLGRLLHDSSPRRDGPFLSLSCSSMNELPAAGLAGLRGGSLFLEEVGGLAPPLQTKLLQVLDDRSPREKATRVLSATHHDLGKDVKAGRFRQDLFFRLSVIELRIPPLRERFEDILRLARELIASVSAELGRRAPALSDQAAALLLKYPWPANLRELENVIERVLLIHQTDIITPEALMRIGVEDVRRPRVGDDVTLRSLEREHTQRVGNFLDTLIVLVNIPVACSGGIFALLITGEPFSVSAAMGFISIFGIAIQDAILVVTYTQRQWAEGKSLVEGANNAAEQRLRPVLMTTLTAMLGLTPAALSHGIGSQTQRPLAIVVIGGAFMLALLPRLLLPPLLVVAHRALRRFKPSRLEFLPDE